MWVAVAAAVVLGAWLWSERKRELFFLSFRSGKLLVIRGRVPQALLNDFSDALRRQQITRATLKAMRRPTGAQLSVGGEIDDFQAQRLRNLFRVYPLSNLSAAPAANDRTVGQVLGIAWLAWMLDR
jgi:hypothetical protein